ncbi:MAG TPA: hypothetical protein VFA46_12845 [Actinomycetes bacterium]|nr:hypothetical protein [Actinomycetes bacterium]
MLAEECDLLVVFGGDGAVHEVVNGLPLGHGGEAPVLAAARVLADCHPAVSTSVISARGQTASCVRSGRAPRP